MPMMATTMKTACTLLRTTTPISSMRVEPPWPTGGLWLRFMSFIVKPPFGSTGPYRRSGGARRKLSAGARTVPTLRGHGPGFPNAVGRRSPSPRTEISAERSLPAIAVGIIRPRVVSSRHRGDVGLSTYRQPIIPPSARATLLSHAARVRDPAGAAPRRTRAAQGPILGLAHPDRPHGADGASPGATAARVWPRRPGGSQAAHAGGQTGEDQPRVVHEDEPLQSGEGRTTA